jgi:hypothetical protein
MPADTRVTKNDLERRRSSRFSLVFQSFFATRFRRRRRAARSALCVSVFSVAAILIGALIQFKERSAAVADHGANGRIGDGELAWVS